MFKARGLYAGTFFGAPLILDWSLLFSIGAALYVGGPMGLLEYAAMIICVLLHEYGHVLMAKKLGFMTKEVGIFPFGGIASIDFGGASDQEMLLIAVAGPITSLCLSLLCYVAVVLPDAFVQPIMGLGFINLVLAIFNMVPIYPFDGGRCFKAVLGMGWGPEVARVGTLIMSAVMSVAIIGLLLWTHSWFGAAVIFVFSAVGVLSLIGKKNP